MSQSERRRLGNAGFDVSAACLGSVSFGRRNRREEAHALLTFAFDHGIDFWDTAEIYPSPPTAETYGRSEEIIGDWLRLNGKRDQIILATKVNGCAAGLYPWVREGNARLDRSNIIRSVDDSLKRLGTEYIDLYQTHWPDRDACRYGQRTTIVPPIDVETSLYETLEVMAELVKSGKVRHVGVSNETPWGVMQHISIAERMGYPRIVSVQNGYNLLNRLLEDGLAEVCERESIGLLAYSPLAAGALTGKYLNGTVPEGSRRSVDWRKPRYESERAKPALRAYIDIAHRYGLDPACMAISWVNQQPFVSSTLISGTNIDQLTIAINAFSIRLSDETLAEIEVVHASNPNPSP